MHIPYSTGWKPIDFEGLCFYSFYACTWMPWFLEQNDAMDRGQLNFLYILTTLNTHTDLGWGYPSRSLVYNVNL